MLLLYAAFFIVPMVQSWYTCNNVDFCTRLRNNKATTAKYIVETTNLDISVSHIAAELVNQKTGKEYTLELTALTGDVYQVVIDDSDTPRHRVQDVINPKLKKSTIQVNQQERQTISLTSGKSKAILQTNPFTIEFYYNNSVVSKINSDSLLVIEDQEPDVAVGIDVLFVGAKNAYGLPSHPESIALRETIQSEPYRLFNIDRSSYGYHETQALYGSVPVLYGHSADTATGFFWLNSAQTFVDIEKGSSGVKAFFMSESGALEFFVLTGPTLKNAVKQYASVTGKLLKTRLLDS